VTERTAGRSCGIITGTSDDGIITGTYDEKLQVRLQEFLHCLLEEEKKRRQGWGLVGTSWELYTQSIGLDGKLRNLQCLDQDTNVFLKTFYYDTVLGNGSVNDLGSAHLFFGMVVQRKILFPFAEL
jgi:hypothetical protein